MLRSEAGGLAALRNGAGVGEQGGQGLVFNANDSYAVGQEREANDEAIRLGHDFDGTVGEGAVAALDVLQARVNRGHRVGTGLPVVFDH